MLPHCTCGEDDPADGEAWGGGMGCVPRRQVREGPVCPLKCPRFTETILCNPMEFSRPEYWSGQPFPSPGDLPNPGIEPGSPALKADSFLFVCLFSCHFLQNSGMDPILPWNCSHTGSGSAQHMQADSSPAESPGSPRILEWVSYPFSSGSSRPRD